ncbi:MAG: lysine-N-methylase, partial [Myxococcales bacterium]|nr:lysine-N-methylase [Myxococcales bacterium]
MGREYERVRAYLTPLVPANRLTAALGSGRQALHLGPQGCVSLTDDHLCRIHAAYGAEAKPVTCQIFPFSFTRTPTGVRVGISYACRGVLDGAGAELEQQRDELTALYSSAVRGSPFLHAVPDRIALDRTLTLDWSAAEVLIDGLAEELCFAGPLVERMARARATVDGLRQGLGDGQAFSKAHWQAVANAPVAAAALLCQRRPPDFFSNALLRA